MLYFCLQGENEFLGDFLNNLYSNEFLSQVLETKCFTTTEIFGHFPSRNLAAVAWAVVRVFKF